VLGRDLPAQCPEFKVVCWPLDRLTDWMIDACSSQRPTSTTSDPSWPSRSTVVCAVHNGKRYPGLRISGVVMGPLPRHKREIIRAIMAHIHIQMLQVVIYQSEMGNSGHKMIDICYRFKRGQGKRNKKHALNFSPRASLVGTMSPSRSSPCLPSFAPRSSVRPIRAEFVSLGGKRRFR